MVVCYRYKVWVHRFASGITDIQIWNVDNPKMMDDMMGRLITHYELLSCWRLKLKQ